jgi:putative ATP-dependent endonuclease of OLD family
MYISSLRIRNYRCFEDTRVEFDSGVTVLIGENNSGKTSLLNALRLIFEGGGARSLEMHDFYRGISPSEEPPGISITATLASAEGEDTPAELGTVATWLSEVGEGEWEAKLTYHYYLPDDQQDAFEEQVGDNPSEEEYWRAVERVLPKYVSRIDAGDPGTEEPGYDRVEPRDLNAFGVNSLDAIRNVEREMFSGRKPKLRSMLDTVLQEDPDAKQELEHEASQLVDDLRERINLEALFELAEETGAEDGGTPDIDGRLREKDFLKALRLVVDAGSGGTLPVTYNGLGYNNLLYISLVLAGLGTETVEEVGPENATVFPMLFIEEPEAHLHPALQFKLLKFVHERVQKEEGSQQVFATTHSTHITSATGLDSVVSLSKNRDGDITPSYPGRVFEQMEGEDGQESKAYVERFLDATKSTMLFARGVILVEGVSEQILIPTLANACGPSLEDEHIAVVGVGGRTFKRFLPLFGGNLEGESPFLDRPVSCIVDADPARRQNGGQYKNCYPYQIGNHEDEFEYRPQSGVVQTLQQYEADNPNIQIFSGEKTLEYDLALANPGLESLITRECVHEEELQTLANEGTVGESLQGKLDDDVSEALDGLEGPHQEAARFATYYLECIEGKAEHAQTLNLNLREVDTEYDVPPYIRDAIAFACQ